MTVSESHPQFTVIIPTKDRAEYLEHTLATCTMQTYENTVIIVSDDGSRDHTRDLVADAARRDSRIQYHRNPGTPGMRDNFEHALNRARSGYVIALGGDDGLLPDGILGMRDALRETRLELLTWAAPIYTYPGVRALNGQMMIYHPKRDKVVSSKEFLLRQAQNLHYLSDIETPMFYVKGVVSTRLIQQVQARHPNGRFYQCPTPDGYSGIVLAGEVQHFAFSARPFTLYGASPTSQGMNYLKNDEQAKKASEAFFKNAEAVPMHSELASQLYSPLISLMTADYLLTAKELDGWPGEFGVIDFRKLLNAGVSELSHGLYGSERLLRELAILLEIARHHGLESYYRKMLDRSRRKKFKQPFTGSGVTPQAVFLDATPYGVHNILDASYAVNHLTRVYADLAPSRLFRLFSDSLRYFLGSRGSGERFPALDT